MITLIGNAPESNKYRKGGFPEFISWIKQQRFYQFDIETDVTDSWINKKLITFAFGDNNGKDQWVLQWSSLKPEQQHALKLILEDKKTTKIIQNAMFEAVVLLSHGITLENVYDTMLMDKIIDGGQHLDGFALSDLTERYLGIRLDKTEQQNFGDDILTESKILYAAEDVIHLGAIRRMQIPILNHTDQDWVAGLENDVVLAYAEMTYNGFDFDQAKWRENLALAEPVIAAAKAKLNDWLKQEPFFSKAKQLGYISDEDKLEIKWTSPQQRGKLLQLIFPDVPGASIGVVKKYWKEHQDHEDAQLLVDYMNKDFTLLQQVLVQFKRQELIDMGLLIPAGVVTINWNSGDQVMPLVKLIEPRIKDLSADTLDKILHQFVRDLQAYKGRLKLTSTYGEKFIEQHVDVDGKVRTTVNQIVSTGRVSTGNPNMQNIVVDESVGSRYRECFIAPEGWKVCGADMSSQELCIIAEFAQDPIWLSALRKGEDLHSVAAEVVFDKDWKSGTEEGCAYYTNNAHQKCKCPIHKKYRATVKNINYMLAYGGGAMKLSGMMNITLDEAESIFKRYFQVFPHIQKFLDSLGLFGLQRGYSVTPAPFFRRRNYPEWSSAVQYLYAHTHEIEFNHVLGGIERRAKNAPIQGGAADQIKTASVLIRNYIHDNGLEHLIKPNLQVHDENVSIVRDDLADMWLAKKKELMEEAAKFSIPSGLLKADTGLSQAWTK